MTRLFVALLFFPAVLLQAQQPEGPAPCGERGQGLATYSYYEAVLDRVHPPDWAQQAITISVTAAGPDTKFILRTDGRSFELLRGTPEKSIYSLLDNLDHSCALPPNPVKAADDLVKVRWERTSLSPGEFRELHTAFALALSKDASNIHSGYASFLTSGVVHIHTPEYTVVYDNGGRHHLSVRLDDSTDDPSKMDPMVRWVRELLRRSQAAFGKTW